MARFDRYMLSQLLMLFGFFSLILVMIYWINRAVRLFDRLIADGQSAWVFLELTSLTLPSLIRIVLPLSAFVAAVYVTNRMAQDAELTVVQATGYSPWRLARPFVYFGCVVAVMMAMLTHVLVPLSSVRLDQRNTEISQNMTAALLVAGEFQTPTDTLTFYMRDMTDNGEMVDIFISETGDANRHVTYTASRAYLVRSDAGPQLVMLNGLVQTFDLDTRRLTTTGFDDFAYDVSPLLRQDDVTSLSVRGLTTWQLIAPSQAILAATGQSAQALMLEVHDRMAQVVLGFVAGLVGFAALIAGGFSRFGLWRNIALAVLLVICLKILESVGAGIASDAEHLWPFFYLAGFGGLGMTATLLWIAERPYFLKRRPAPLRAAGGARL